MLLGNPKVKAMTDEKLAIYQTASGHLRLTERFFSIEGEGVLIGCPTYLIRFASCNQRCQRCDSKFSSWWDTDAVEVPAEEVLRDIQAQPAAEWVSFTGGEPFYRQPGELGTMSALAKDILRLGRKLKVETSGTILPPAEFPSQIMFWSIAPKLPGGGMGTGTFLDPELLQTLLSQYVKQGHVKFVIGAREKDSTLATDFEQIKALAKLVPALTAGRLPVIFQPEGLTESSTEYLERCRTLVEAVLADPELMASFPSWRILPQWHQLLWRNERRR